MELSNIDFNYNEFNIFISSFKINIVLFIKS